AWAMAELLGAVAPALDPAHDPATRTASSTPDPEPTALATEVWAAPSADAEVLIALRRLSTLHREGTPLERMALLHSGSAPYPRLVEDALVASGMPFNGPGTRPLSATVAGRTLLGFLELAERGWRRDDLMAWLSGAPLLHRGRPAPAAAWDLLSCDARVIVGLEEWRDRLAAHATVLRRRAAWLDERDADPDDGAGIAPPSLRREADACEELWHFVEGLADRTAAVPDRWAAWGRWCRHLLDELLGGPAARASWPTAEVAALDTVVDALGGLAALDEVDRRPALADVRAALESELEVAAPQTSRFGHGILCGRLEDAVGCDFDVVWVLGMMDGAFPASATDDVLVPDRDRELVADETELPRRASRRAEAERDLLAALAGPAVRILSYSVGDQRQGGELRPARPLLDALGELAGGRRLYAKDLPLAGLAAQAAAGRSFAVPSFAAAATGAGTPASADDWDLRSMARWVDDGHRPTGHFRAAEDSVLARGLALRRARRSNRLTRFDGRVDVPTPSPAAAPRHEVQPVAPTALERYARCPRQHLLATVLGLSPRERPEEVFRISPLDRGMAVHRVLERYVAGEILRSAASEVPARPLLAGDAAGPQLGSPQLGSPVATVADAGHVDPDPARVDAADEARLLHLAAEVFAELEEQRLTGRDALWEIDRATIVTSLRQFLVGDREHRRHRGAVPVAVEERFGAGDGSAVVVDLGGGRRIAFGGRIDRVDRTGDGGVFVLDYKSGRPAESEGPMPDPLSRGARLQLAVYGLAARQHYRPEGRTAAGYWYLGGDGALAWCELSPELEGTLVNTLRVVTEAIDRGAFPARPGDPDHRGRGKNCSTCAFDAVCPADRHREWQRKRSDPWIADYVALAEPGDAVVGDAEPGDAEPGR
ncbi:MAG: PD-(D/E)XK nuclease family protein, partial [Acidimicrobiales bacterium]